MKVKNKSILINFFLKNKIKYRFKFIIEIINNKYYKN